MTRNVFWEDPCQTVHEATVTSVAGGEVGRLRLKRQNMPRQGTDRAIPGLKRIPG
jgi:hypothetical protein